jgi:hypothetical protein
VLTDNLNVDQFFSLWLVFNNDDVKMSGMFWNCFCSTLAVLLNSSCALLDPNYVLKEGMLPNATVEWYFVFGILLVQISARRLVTPTEVFRDFFSVPRGKCPDNTSNWPWPFPFIHFQCISRLYYPWQRIVVSWSSR